MKKRILAILMATALLCGVAPLGVAAAGQTMPLTTPMPADFITFGRVQYTLSAGLRMFWTNSGFAVTFEGTSLSAAITTTSVAANQMGYLNVYVDGALVPTATVKIDKNNADYVLAENLPLSLIAQQCGFGSDSAFISMFRRHMGMTPGKYRRNTENRPKS